MAGGRNAFQSLLKRTLTTALVCTAGVSAATALAAGNSQSIAPSSLKTRGELLLTNGMIRTTAEAPMVAATRAQLLTAGAGKHFLIQFTESVTAADRAALEAAGVKLVTYVTDNAWYAAAGETGIDVAALAGVAKLRTSGPIEARFKLHRDLLVGEVPSYSIILPDASEFGNEDLDADKLLEEPMRAVGAADRVAAYVMFHPDVDRAAAENALVTHGALLRSFIEPINLATIEVNYGDLLALSREDGVQYVEPPLPKFSTLNAENRVTTQVATLQAPPYGLNGTGVTAMVYDGGTVRATHQDFGGRSTNSDTDAVSSHATHVSGTVAGNGAASAGNNRGMAPNALLVNYGFEQPGGLQQGFLYTDPGDFAADYTDAFNARGADIANNSIGTNTAPNGFPCTWEGDYGLMSNLIDAAVRGSMTGGAPIRIAWANGNERQVSTCLGVDGFESPFHSTAPPACAKNHVAVGAVTENGLQPATFTSFGPSDDGRIKPDISAPGVNVLSTTSSSDTAYATLSGTSMASPTVCGIGALMLQDFRANYPGSPDFRNSTFKMWLAHTAADQLDAVDDRGPDYRYGYGVVRAQAAVELERSGNWIERNPGLSQGETYSFFLLVPAGSTEARVTLVWDDAPSAPVALGALVNDLELRVFNSSGTRFYPWTLNPGPTGLDAPAVRTTEDHRNNIEQVVIDSPAAGVYRVDIVGHSVPQGPQSFSVAATPQLINCSSQGLISLDGALYPCSADAGITVVDCDLNTSNTVVDTVMVHVESTSDPAGFDVLLTETAPETATFTGTVMLRTITGPPGILLIANGDTVTATYQDADNGAGSPATVTSTATIDCLPPVLLSVVASNVTPSSATVTITTSEPTSATLRLGTACGTFPQSFQGLGLQTTRVFELTGLADVPVYHMAFDLADGAGNTVSDNNGGACYSFSQPVLNLPFNDEFPTTTFDLNKWSIIDSATIDDVGIAEPSGPNSARLNGSPDGADSITSQIIDLSTAGAVRLTYWFQITGGGESPDANDDLFVEFKDAGGVWIILNQHLGSGPDMTTYTRVSQTLPPAALHAAFRLRIRSTGTAGAFDDYFVDSVSLSLANAPEAIDVSVSGNEGQPRMVTLNAVDPNNDPLTYIVLSLPSGSTLSDPNGGAITTVPYSLLGNGADVRVTPNPGFGGLTSFQYKATDGTFESNIANASVFFEPVLSLPFSDSFPSNGGFDPVKWTAVSNATVDDVGTAEPSPNFSARFNGFPTGGDSVQTFNIDASDYQSLTLSYYFQTRGGGESPDAGEDLIVEYRDASNAWIEISRHLGSGPDMTTYQLVTLPLPAGALHSTLRVRIRNTGTSSATSQFDDWFVDDILIDGVQNPSLLGDMNCDGAVTVGDIAGFVLALTDPLGYAATYPGCDINNADLNGDTVISVGDIAVFVGVLLN